MKMVLAIIRIDKMNATKQALTAAGITSMTATGKVFGRGKGTWDAQVLEGVKQDMPEALTHLGKEPRLRPQRVLNIAVSDHNVQLTIDTIIEVNQTPAPGDGKIFVLPLDDTYRVRTGETGTTIL
ncbi:P-II family nitrogen regulator [Draconibacterium sp. IB214405]|uniref:P-II family nitrogen regulator n=1 Tax=Draconibacterium sp. IB214405 TaxID=3097352 RepID=UPI002A0E6E44|nr:P-II family nitrogen regulator [Draconibacterium sp. IB214405]MDX8341309.1 P-II family nitrogen regulator [Draconibacterium sp. IB214405]